MPLSIQVHRLPIDTQSLWVWHMLSDASVHERKHLGQGWELIESTNLSFPLLALMSQLAQTLPILTMGRTVLQTWVKNEDLAATAAHPVILAFSHDQDPKQLALFPSAPQRPGEVGIIVEEDQLNIYQLSALGEQGIEWSNRLKMTCEEALIRAATLDDSAWKTAQQAAQMLSLLYWNLHLQQEVGEPLETDLTILPVTEKKPAKRTRNTRQQQAALVVRDPDAIEFTADYITHAILRGLLSDELYTQDEENLTATHERVVPHQGTVNITIRPESYETWEHVLESLSLLGDEVVDTFCAVIALAYDASPQDISQPFFLNVDDILRVRRRKLSNGSFTPSQRIQVISHLIALSRVHVTATGLRRRGARKTAGFINSVVLELLKTVIGEYETLTGEILWERREVKIGTWAKFAPFGPQTALLFRTILEYHAQRQKYAKRFGRELTIQFYIQAQKKRSQREKIGDMASLELTIEELLTLSEITLTPDNQNPDNPSRIKKMIEEAFKLLQKDKVIGSYDKIAVMRPGKEKTEQQRLQELDIQKRINECAQGWWPLYTRQLWRFDPPAVAHRLLLAEPKR